MSDRRCGSRTLCALAFVVLVPLMVFAQSEESGATLEDVVQTVQSFQRLGIIDPAAAGAVWMTEEAADDWRAFIEATVSDATEAVALFAHAIWFAEVTQAGVTLGALYNPWVGSLVVFRMDDRATVLVEHAAISLTETPLELLDAESFAVEAMARIEDATARFEQIAAAGALPDDADWPSIASGIDRAANELRWLYGTTTAASQLQENVLGAVSLVEQGSRQGALSLLRQQEDVWVANAFPISVVQADSDALVFLVATEAPLDLIALHVSGTTTGDPVESVSVIQLFDRLTTRGGDGR